MGKRKEFYGREIGFLSGSVWRAGNVNSRVTARSATVRRSGFCLEEGAPYEVEGALGATEGQARALAVVQDLERAKSQLTPPIFPGVFYERCQPIMTCIEFQGVEVLHLDGPDDRERLGLVEEPASLVEAAAARRRVVKDLRALNWDGAIVLPGFDEESKMVVLSRRYLLAGAFRVWQRGALAGRIPAQLTDFVLGLRQDFPAPSEIGALPIKPPPPRLVTPSWQPPPPSPRTPEAPRRNLRG